MSYRLYAVGKLDCWAAATVGIKKNDSLEVIKSLAAKFNGLKQDGCTASDNFFNKHDTRIVSFEEWQIIDSVEAKAASEGAPCKNSLLLKEWSLRSNWLKVPNVKS